MDTCLRVRIALHADRLARTFSSTRIGLRALSSHGQTSEMAQPSIALDALQPLEIHSEFAAQIPFDHVFAVLDRLDDLDNCCSVRFLARMLGSIFAFANITFEFTGPMP